MRFIYIWIFLLVTLTAVTLTSGGCALKPVLPQSSQLTSNENSGDQDFDEEDGDHIGDHDEHQDEHESSTHVFTPGGTNRKIPMDWPVDEARFSRGFKASGRHRHWGIDLAAPLNTPIFSAQDGRVIYAGRGFRGYGRLIIIESEKGLATLYGHLAKITVKEGQPVNKGQEIGKMGRSGRATGVHLHFEVRANRVPVDPLPYLPDTTPLKQIASESLRNFFRDTK